MNMRPSRRELMTIELTPLIDVVFLLLIFFLLTSSITQANSSASRESSIPIELPEAQSGSTSVDGDPVTLTVAKDGKIVLEGGTELKGNSIEERLLNLYTQDPKAQILLRGDSGATHGRVIELLGIVKGLGFKSVDLVIQSPSTAP